MFDAMAGANAFAAKWLTPAMPEGLRLDVPADLLTVPSRRSTTRQ